MPCVSKVKIFNTLSVLMFRVVLSDLSNTAEIHEKHSCRCYHAVVLVKLPYTHSERDNLLKDTSTIFFQSLNTQAEHKAASWEERIAHPLT